MFSTPTVFKGSKIWSISRCQSSMGWLDQKFLIKIMSMMMYMRFDWSYGGWKIISGLILWILIDEKCWSLTCTRICSLKPIISTPSLYMIFSVRILQDWTPKYHLKFQIQRTHWNLSCTIPHRFFSSHQYLRSDWLYDAKSQILRSHYSQVEKQSLESLLLLNWRLGLLTTDKSKGDALLGCWIFVLICINALVETNGS